MFALTPEQFGEHPHALIGSVDSICEQIIERRERYGISYITVGRAAMESFAPVVERLAGTEFVQLLLHGVGIQVAPLEGTPGEQRRELRHPLSQGARVSA